MANEKPEAGEDFAAARKVGFFQSLRDQQLMVFLHKVCLFSITRSDLAPNFG